MKCFLNCLSNVEMISSKENLKRVLLREKPNRIPVECPINPKYGDGAYQFVTYQGALPPRAGGEDLWGTKWAGSVGEELPNIVETPFSSLEEIIKNPFPDIDNPILWQEAREKISAHSQSELSCGRQVSCLWERLHFLYGFERTLVALSRQAELVFEILSKIADWQIRAAERFIDIGVDLVRISDDYGTQTDLMMSPASWRKIIKPQLKRLVQVYQNANVPVALHSCGNLYRIMDDLIELGFVAFNIQTNANDVIAYKKRYGIKFCLWGGVSTQSVLVSGTNGQIRTAVRDAIVHYGGDLFLILEPDQIVQVPKENLAVFYQAALEMREAHQI